MLKTLKDQIDLSQVDLFSSNCKTAKGSQILKDPERKLLKLFDQGEDTQIIVYSKRYSGQNDLNLPEYEDLINSEHLQKEADFLKKLIKRLNFIKNHLNRRENSESLLNLLCRNTEKLLFKLN